MSMDIEVDELIYKNIENDFNYKFFNFNYYKKKDCSKLSYYKALISYLNNKGYGYIATQVNEIINNYKIDDIKIAKLLMDCNLINKYNKSIKSSIEDKTIIEYNNEYGLRKTINIEYKTHIPFKIVNVAYSNIDIISHKINSIKNEVVININIDSNKRVNFTEIISIYTPYGVDKLEFTVKCKDNNNKYFDIDNIEDYLKICRENPIKAEKIFYSNDFIKWLKQKNYKIHLINYNEAKKLTNSIEHSSFDMYCRLNGIYLINEDKLEVNYKNINIDTNNNNIETIVKEETKEVKEETKEVEPINTEKVDIDNSNTEKKEKSIFSGIKKKIGSIFKRK